MWRPGGRLSVAIGVPDIGAGSGKVEKALLPAAVTVVRLISKANKEK